ncbi:MAG: hypothetical protein RL375_4458, partial [Pseudomonadota bacterium]
MTIVRLASFLMAAALVGPALAVDLPSPAPAVASGPGASIAGALAPVPLAELVAPASAMAGSGVGGAAATAGETRASEPGASGFRLRPVDDAWRASLPRQADAATQAYLDRLPADVVARSS